MAINTHHHGEYTVPTEWQWMLRPGLVCRRVAVARCHPVEHHAGTVSRPTTATRSLWCQHHPIPSHRLPCLSSPLHLPLVPCLWRPIVTCCHPHRTIRLDAISARRRGVPGQNGGTGTLCSRPTVACYRTYLPSLRSGACGGRTGDRTWGWTGRCTGR